MNTPAHLIISLAAFGRPGQPRVTAAAVAGGLIPDLSLYLMAGTHLFLMGTPPEVVFGQLYFSDAWQSVFRIDNSFVLWGIGLALGLMLKSPATVALTAAGLLHLAGDFPLHNDDARAQFWPVTNWVFASPVSYWDRSHYGNIVGPLEIALCLGLSVWLLTRFRRWPMRAFIVLLGLVEALPGLIWIFVLH